jgi:hypothetical protein
MPTSEKCKLILFRIVFEILNLDFILQPWILRHGIVKEKGIRMLIRKNDDTPFGMFPWGSTMEHWNWIFIYTSFTSGGREKLLIPEAICDCIEPGDRLAIEIQTSFLFSKRTRVRLAKEKRLKQPV